jgi:hypothetical protein
LGKRAVLAAVRWRDGSVRGSAALIQHEEGKARTTKFAKKIRMALRVKRIKKSFFVNFVCLALPSLC